MLDGRQRFVSASIGIACADGADATAERAAARRRRRDVPGQGARQGALRGLRRSLRARAVERLELEGGLRDALDRGELSLHYQPEVPLPTAAMFGVEALLRWQHPTRGAVSPPTLRRRSPSRAA